ncbi:adenylate/guanylate cyclase domain-containing protein [Vineibacter terrae]|uniref:Adenylate/guanylate cyclase domain-containing protein n=1 Tax=Vineibacter terrae TaxID=2586908 RepID=A0A5C8PIW8_9HYPH|nr:adenylate/guanylate cyclase domain-containing protein [Vineibacter terrae]TXL73755.1 adenylate/guanylate cyclase domain-containing protein [Vineibacter terrae]
MQLPFALGWLVDAAGDVRGADDFLASLGAQLIADGLPLAAGALTLAAPHPIIARRTWLWRAQTGAVIEALGFEPLAPTGFGKSLPQDNVARSWLAQFGDGVVLETIAAPDGPALSWTAQRRLTESEAALLRQAARFAAAPLAVLASRSTIAALLEAYLGRRSAAQVLAGRLRRETGETIRAVLLYGDLRGFTELSESMAPEAVVEALDAWFDRIGGAVHAFGGEVLKFIGDGVLAIFPIGDRPASAACDAALRAVDAARAGMAHLDRARARQGLPPLPFGLALHLGEMLWGNIGTADRLDFTAIGSAVNLVSRLEGLCKPLGRSVLISGTAAAEATTPLLSLGEHTLRGIAAPCAVFTLRET